ncbi:putative NADH-flavin reductase [Bacteroidales bacterium Barb7]|nr:putative NADH-flavin reductase [Bacteroidales bacterium Barb7]
MKKAVLFGASGFVGSYLLDELLNNPDYEEVIVVVRKNLNINHPKLSVLIGDYHSLPDLKEQIVADDVFIVLGTTKKKTPKQAEYYQIDHDYPVLAAKMAQENGATSVFVVTAIGANPKSSVFYVRTKGEAERDITALNFEHTHIFRPSMIMGNRKEKPLVEKIMSGIWLVLNPLFIGNANKYKGIRGENIAKAMNNAAKNQTEKVKIYHWAEMNDLL